MRPVTLDEYLNNCTKEELLSMVEEIKEELLINPSITSQMNALYLNNLIKEKLTLLNLAEHINDIFKKEIDNIFKKGLDNE